MRSTIKKVMYIDLEEKARYKSYLIINKLKNKDIANKLGCSAEYLSMVINSKRALSNKMYNYFVSIGVIYEDR